MKKSLLFCLVCLMCVFTSCQKASSSSDSSLRDKLYAIADSVSGVVGIAFVSDGDTVTVNNGVAYPMMSVFKLHQSLAVGKVLELNGTGLDSILSISAGELDRETWSPMLKKYIDKDFTVTVGELVRYSLVSSDNNASNLLFSHIVSPVETDGLVKSLAMDTTFHIRYSEADMKQNHSLSYLNCTSPLAAAVLIKHVFNSDLVCRASQDSIKSALTVVTTGQNRLGAAVMEGDGVLFGHKTGSGYRNDVGELIAHNDVGYFRLPDGRDYSLAVFIRDFNGSEDEASAVIAEISKCVYNDFVGPENR